MAEFKSIADVYDFIGELALARFQRKSGFRLDLLEALLPRRAEPTTTIVV